MIRKDWNDQIFRTEKEKNDAIVSKISECKKNGQPILIFTSSINNSEKYSMLLNKQNIKHIVLNAKNHEKEAEIIANAGKINSVIITTSISGRGVDIQLGGKKDSVPKGELHLEKEKIKSLGGLFVIGTERMESRRVDNQARGRSGRQGDEGNSIFYVSLEDDLMRIFGSESMNNILQKLGLKDGESIDHPWINKALERAQQRVEARNFDIRKTLLKFDDVMNDQRKVIFEQRKEILKSNDVNDVINNFLDDLCKNFSNEKLTYERENQIEPFKKRLRPILGRSFKDDDFQNIFKSKSNEFENIIKNKFNELRSKRSEVLTNDANLKLEKRVFLQTVDFLWRSHLQYLDHLRQVVGLRGYAQKDPLEEFKREAFKLFEDLLNKIKIDFITFLNNLEFVEQEEVENKSIYLNNNIPKNNPNCLLVTKKNEKISRNEKCPATGKKYKHCCGSI